MFKPKDSYHRTASPDRYEILKAFAKENRANMTEAEQVLWQCLRRYRQDGHRFFRQYVIGDYIVDFVSLYEKLVIEVDGGYHAEREQQEDDAIRTEVLRKLGYNVIRFTNEQVLFDIDQTLETIEQQLTE